MASDPAHPQDGPSQTGPARQPGLPSDAGLHSADPLSPGLSSDGLRTDGGPRADGEPLAPDGGPLAPDGAAAEAEASPDGRAPPESGPAPAGPDLRSIQRRTLTLLVGTQVLGGVGVAIGIAVGTLLAAELAGTDALAGLAASAMVVGAAVLAIPISRVMDRRGRRPGLLLAYAVSALGAAVIVVAGLVGSFPLGLAGMVLFGGATAGNLQARYAAVDLAPPDRRGTALSVVVWATTVGAVLGPNLAEPTGRLAAGLGVPSLAGPFLLSLVVFTASAGIIGGLLRPDPLLTARASRGEDVTARRPRVSLLAALRTVRNSPAALLGLGAVAVGHAVMVAVMTMTPVHLQHGGATLQVVGLVISVHIAGMFALSPLVGILCDRVGRRPVILLGCVLQLAACAIAGTAAEHESVQVGVGLTLLGLGWSCTLVAGSTLLTESVSVDARPTAQGASDFIMNLGGAAASLVAGAVVGLAGYALLALIAAIVVLPLLAATVRPLPQPAGNLPA